MNALVDQPPIRPTSDSLRRHFRERRETNPGPIDNPDSLAFKSLYDQHGRDAAVLIPIVEAENGLEMLLTRRADHLAKHAGQVSFPGGRIEPSDESFVATALRETEEEIGISAVETEVLGTIGSVYTVTGYHVTPVLGLLREPLSITPDPNEVAEVLTVPVDFLMNPGVYERQQHQYEDSIRTYYTTSFGEYRIWGITAGILVALYEELRETHS